MIGCERCEVRRNHAHRINNHSGGLQKQNAR